jgi:glucose/arabinose dehydrogenase
VWDTPKTFLLALGDRYHYKDHAQSLSDYYGVIVRLNEDGTPAKTKLASSSPETRPGIWSYGHRNPQGLVIDPIDGEIWSHEHGPQGGDEINHLHEAKNYGWPAATFGIDYDDSIISETPLLAGTEPPVYYWYPSIAPSGLAIYSGSEFPKWRGDLFVGGLRSQRLHRLERLNGHIISDEELLVELKARIRDVRTGPGGSLYILTDEEAGRLLKIRPTTASKDASE